MIWHEPPLHDPAFGFHRSEPPSYRMECHGPDNDRRLFSLLHPIGPLADQG
jgi:hypothetical protein